MLKRIRIRGFRSCKDVTIDLPGPVTALVGWFVLPSHLRFVLHRGLAGMT